MSVSPVMLPPGRATFATKPAATGSATTVMTMGMVFVASATAWTAAVVPTTTTSTLSATSSPASLGKRSGCPSAQR
jgi:hypothetical protein